MYGLGQRFRKMPTEVWSNVQADKKVEWSRCKALSVGYGDSKVIWNVEPAP